MHSRRQTAVCLEPAARNSRQRLTTAGCLGRCVTPPDVGVCRGPFAEQRGGCLDLPSSGLKLPPWKHEGLRWRAVNTKPAFVDLSRVRTALPAPLDEQSGMLPPARGPLAAHFHASRARPDPRKQLGGQGRVEGVARWDGSVFRDTRQRPDAAAK